MCTPAHHLAREISSTHFFSSTDCLFFKSQSQKKSIQLKLKRVKSEIVSIALFFLSVKHTTVLSLNAFKPVWAASQKLMKKIFAFSLAVIA